MDITSAPLSELPPVTFDDPIPITPYTPMSHELIDRLAKRFNVTCHVSGLPMP